MSVKAMLIVAILGGADVTQFHSDYSSWQRCIDAKALVLGQRELTQFGTARIEDDIIAVCVPIEDREEEDDREREREVWRNLNEIIKTFKSKPNTLTE